MATYGSKQPRIFTTASEHREHRSCIRESACVYDEVAFGVRLRTVDRGSSTTLPGMPVVPRALNFCEDLPKAAKWPMGATLALEGSNILGPLTDWTARLFAGASGHYYDLDRDCSRKSLRTCLASNDLDTYQMAVRAPESNKASIPRPAQILESLQGTVRASFLPASAPTPCLWVASPTI